MCYLSLVLDHCQVQTQCQVYDLVVNLVPFSHAWHYMLSASISGLFIKVPEIQLKGLLIILFYYLNKLE